MRIFPPNRAGVVPLFSFLGRSIMYAVIKTGGKQYRVTKDDVITVERVAGVSGASVTFDEVLMVGDKAGTPNVAGASVKGRIVEQSRGDKIVVFKKKRRKDYKRTAGHRQDLTVIQITDIDPVKKPEATAKKATAKKATAKKATAKKATAKKATAKKATAKEAEVARPEKVSAEES